MTIPIKIIPVKDLKERPDQEKIWDTISVPWDTYVIKKLTVVDEFLKDKKGKVLDLGCGSGRNMVPNKNIQYFGVDFSGEQIINAKKNTQKEGVDAKFFKTNADDLSCFNDKMFDAGLFIATLHCLESASARKDSLKEFYRVLKKGAEGLISVWNSDAARFNGKKGEVYMSWKRERVPYMRYYYLYDKQELIDLLEDVGFEVLEFYEPREKDRFFRMNWIIRVRKQ
jgi:ubiquinone/menaquinone biosynthesis C-methylase UbiE